MSTSMVTRAGWGARKPRHPGTPVNLSLRTATCTHHDGSVPIKVTTRAQAIALVRRDQSYHMDSNGWDDIGYNFLVISAPGYPEVDGLIFEGRGRDIVGAHCKDWNTPWIGIQLAIGGDQVPSPKSLASVRRVHDDIEAYAGRALAKKGHYQGFATACPGTFLKTWLAAGMPVGAAPVIKAKVAVINVVKAVVKAPAVIKARATANLVVDGDFGAATRKRLQQWGGTAQDGVLGIASWKAIQRRLNITADGIPGILTWKAIQRMVRVVPDGAPGVITIKALQRYLNNH